MFGHAGSHRLQHSIFADSRKYLFRLFFFLPTQRGFETLLNTFPPVLNNSLPLCLELIALTDDRNLGFVKDVLFTGSCQKAHTNQRHDLLLRLRKLGDVLLFKLDSGNNGMVVSDLRIVGHAPNIGIMSQTVKNRQFPTNDGDDLTGSSLHVIGDELAVCTGIGQELLFIESLYQFKRLLRGKAEISVCFSLQGSQIVELRRVCRLRFLADRRNDGLLFITSRRNGLRLIFGFDLFHVSRQAVLLHMDIEILLFAEIGYSPVALHQHCQSGSLHTPDYQPFIIKSGEKPGAINPDNPICL